MREHDKTEKEEEKEDEEEEKGQEEDEGMIAAMDSLFLPPRCRSTTTPTTTSTTATTTTTATTPTTSTTVGFHKRYMKQHHLHYIPNGC